jgi:hypothetical protein
VATRDAHLQATAEALGRIKGELAAAVAQRDEAAKRLQQLEQNQRQHPHPSPRGASPIARLPSAGVRAGNALMGEDAPLEQLHFQILKSWCALSVPHGLRAAAVGHPSWRSRRQCQSHIAMLACLHQLAEDDPERADAAEGLLREEAAVLEAGLAALPGRWVAAGCSRDFLQSAAV